MQSSINLVKLTQELGYYYVLIVCSFGFLTNFMNVQVSLRKEIQKTTMGFYNICLSISNVFGLIFVGFIGFFPQSIGANLLVKSDILCKLLPYFSRFFFQLNSWLNVMVSIDRVILMSYENVNAYNNRSPHLKDKSKLFRLISALIVILLVINVPGLLFYLTPQTIAQDFVTNKTEIIPVQCKSSRLIGLFRDFIGIASRTILPLIIRFILTLILIYKLFSLKVNAMTLSLKKEYSFTFTIVIINFIFILADTFILITTIFINIYGYNQTFVSLISNESAIASFVYVVSVMSTLLFYFVLLFFVNLFVHKRFRRETRKLYLQWIYLRLR